MASSCMGLAPSRGIFKCSGHPRCLGSSPWERTGSLPCGIPFPPVVRVGEGPDPGQRRCSPAGLCALTQAERFPLAAQQLWGLMIRNSPPVPSLIHQSMSIEGINWGLSSKLCPTGDEPQPFVVYPPSLPTGVGTGGRVGPGSATAWGCRAGQGKE